MEYDSEIRVHLTFPKDKANRIRVLWIAPYPIDRILPSDIFVRQGSKGKANWLVNLSEKLSQEEAIELYVLTYSANIKEDQFISKNGVNFYILKYNFPFLRKGFPLFFRYDILTGYRGFIKRAIKLIDEIKPDILHAHGTEGAYGLIPEICKKYPAVISIQGIISEIIRQKFNLFQLIQRHYEKRCIKNNRNFGCRTNWDKSFVVQTNPEAVIYYMPEAINITFFDHQWRDMGKNQILFVGAVLKRKGIEDLLNALISVKDIIPDVTLDVIGKVTDRYYKFLISYLRKNGIIDKVNWLGFKSPIDIAGFLQTVSVYVLPTYSDNSPNSLCEAMATGTPTIAYSTGGIPSLITNGKDGLLVETGNVERLATTIIKVLQDKELRLCLSQNSRLTARERNCPAVVSQMTLKVYNEIIGIKQ